MYLNTLLFRRRSVPRVFTSVVNIIILELVADRIPHRTVHLLGKLVLMLFAKKDKAAAKEVLEHFVPDLVRACGDGTTLPTISDALIAPAVVCFVSIKNMDTAPVSYDTSQTFFGKATETLLERKGLRRQFIRDDKGTVFIGTFRREKVRSSWKLLKLWFEDCFEIVSRLFQVSVYPIVL